jgi:hypothetical protein
MSMAQHAKSIERTGLYFPKRLRPVVERNPERTGYFAKDFRAFPKIERRRVQPLQRIRASEAPACNRETPAERRGRFSSPSPQRLRHPASTPH